MKKHVLIFLTILLSSVQVDGQMRYVLYEEFSGEDCNPCAVADPILWDMMQSGTNPSKILLIKYMAPYYGPFSQQDYDDASPRYDYYSVASWPNSRMDGRSPDPADPASTSPFNLTQTMIDNEQALPSAFNLSVSYVWNATFDSITATVTINCVNNFSPVGANMVLRAALVETVDFANPPGTNGEKHFENVVRFMYPDAMGTPIANSWAAGSTQTLTLTGPVPAYVDKSSSPFMVVWIQNDNDKYIAQTAKSAALQLPMDAGMQAPPLLYCTSGSSTAPEISLVNTGATTLTSATIYYKIDGGALMSQSWTGSLAPGGIALVSLPPVATGMHSLYDSVAAPNGANDVNIANNTNSTTFTVRSNETKPMPLSADFESGLPDGWTFFDANANGYNWKTVAVPNHNGASGTKAAVHGYFSLAYSEANYLIIPATGQSPKILSFWTSFAHNMDDSLYVVYSADCGITWNNVWAADGAMLQTAGAMGTVSYIPDKYGWKKFVVDVSAVPPGAMIAFKATSNYYSNNLYIDDINLTDPVFAPNLTQSGAEINVYPVPVKDMTTVSFTLLSASQVRMLLCDATGRFMYDRDYNNLNAGYNEINISTAGLSNGLYFLSLKTGDAVSTKRLVIVR